MRKKSHLSLAGFLVQGMDNEVLSRRWRSFYLGNILPAAIMAVLIVYCLKSAPMDFGGTGMYQLLAAGVCVLLHVWKKNTLFSIVGSTAFYMILLQFA